MPRAASEASIHFEFYRHLQNNIEIQTTYSDLEFADIGVEVNVNGGFADILISTSDGRFCVIEAKRRERHNITRDIDPFSPDVINQAFHYAGAVGAPYFATFNGRYLVLFSTFEEGTPLLQRRVRAYKIEDLRKFAAEFLGELAGLESGRVGWDPSSRAFVKRLNSFHDRLYRELNKSFSEHLDAKEFQQKFQGWVTNQGWDVDAHVAKTRFLNQATYLLMNKLFFYKVLEDTGHNVPEIPLKNLVNPEARRQFFDDLIQQADFKAIYEQDPIFDEIPLNERAREDIERFLEELGTYNFGSLRHDTIGHIYEDIIPPKERHDLGQYYTPPQIVELINKLTIRNPNDIVLDPGCGSGTFLISAYNRLKDLKEEYGIEVSHPDILQQLYGIDINRFPGHLTAINLALQNLGVETEQVNVEKQDFFNIWPHQGRLHIEKSQSGDDIDNSQHSLALNIPQKVDAIVANPPYIRQELIPDKELCRKHLERLGYENISERSDIYVYFFTHATEFLRGNHSRIGFITSDKWLTVKYGRDLQNFFIENFKIKAIISFSKRVFETPLVPTCVTILERCNEQGTRNSNIVKFIRVKGNIHIDELSSLICSDYESNILEENDNYRIITKQQEELKGIEKWNRYLYAPPVYWQLIGSKKICKLADVADVRFGIKTGANKFFYLNSNDIESWGINPNFLRPVAKSIRQTETIEFTVEDTDIFVLDMHKYIIKKLEDIPIERIKGLQIDKKKLPQNAKLDEITSKEEYILHCLHQDGYTGLFEYIVRSMWERDWGLNNPPHKRPTCKQYREQNGCWFNLGELEEPDLILAKGYWENIFVPLNIAKAVVDCRIYEIHTSEPELLAGILNSSLSKLFRELHCRITGGGLSEMMVYESEDLPILDPRSLTNHEKENIKAALNTLRKRNELSSLELDRAVLAPLGLEEDAEDISQFAIALSKARREGKEVSEMISGIEEIDKKGLRGAKIIGKTQARLDKFQEVT
jgi:type I restriction-modification system DNA methylase subunit